MANTTGLETVVFGLLPNHHVEARNGTGDHQVDETHEVTNEKDYKHHTVQKRGCLYVVAVIGIAVEHIVAMIKPYDHCAVCKSKSADVIVQLVLVSVPYHVDLHQLKGAPREVQCCENH